MNPSGPVFENQQARRIYTFTDQSRAMSIALGCAFFAIVCLVLFFSGLLVFVGVTRFLLLVGAVFFAYATYQYGWLEPISAMIQPDQRVALRCAFRWRHVALEEIRSLDLKNRNAVLNANRRERVMSINLNMGAVAVLWRGTDAAALAEELSKLNSHIYVKEELLEELMKHDR